MSAERFRKPGWKILGALLLLGILMAGAWGARASARRMAFFRVRAIEVRGTHYLDPKELVARLAVDTLSSLWDDVEPLRARLRTHPQVTKVAIARKMPGTLVVTVTENLPVGLVSTPAGLMPYDATGKQLPIDPSLRDLDLPVVATDDPVLLKLVGSIRAAEPEVFARIEEARRTGRDEILLTLSRDGTPAVASDSGVSPRRPLRVRVPTGLPVDRLSDIFPVESDLARRQARVAELDLRYRDQVVARVE